MEVGGGRKKRKEGRGGKGFSKPKSVYLLLREEWE
jgi:hypothetical protein